MLSLIFGPNFIRIRARLLGELWSRPDPSHFATLPVQAANFNLIFLLLQKWRHLLLLSATILHDIIIVIILFIPLVYMKEDGDFHNLTIAEGVLTVQFQVALSDCH